MQLRQIQVVHEAIQDRLVLRVSTQANEEFRVFLTRRFLRKLWPRLVNAISPPQAQALAQEGDETPGTAPSTSFDEPFNDADASYPLGANPLLASECQLTRRRDEPLRLCFREGRERTFNLTLENDLLETLCAMLRAAADTAQWDLTLDYGSTASIAETPLPPLLGGPENHGLLH